MRKCQITKLIGLALLLLPLYVSAQTDSVVVAGDSLLPIPEERHPIDPLPIDPNDTMLKISDSMASSFEPYEGKVPYGTTLEGMSLRMITGQTTRVLQRKTLEFCVQHRFGFFSQGKSQFYGLDQSDVRLGFDYGLTRRTTIGIGRSSLGKVYNGFVKMAITKQGTNGAWFNVTWLSDLYLSGMKNTDPNLDPYYFSHRLKYTHQLLISRTFNEKIMVSVAPTIIHRNLVDSVKYPNDLSMLVFNARWNVTHGINLTGEYSYMFNHDMRNLYSPCIGAGIEFYTSGHIFQIVFSNSNSMNEGDAYAMQNGKISKGNIRMGFNIVRLF